jgi:hypothetical protein
LDSDPDKIAENSASYQNKSREYTDLGDDKNFFNELPPDFYLQVSKKISSFMYSKLSFESEIPREAIKPSLHWKS